MIKLRDDHMDSLSESSRSRFEDRLLEHIQEMYSAEEPHDISREVLAPEIHRAVDRALYHGIEDEPDVTAFVEITFEVGEGFDTDPENTWASEILNDRDLDPHEKITLLQQLLGEAEDDLRSEGE
jgi:hypothetical protein